jgi:hypothetical protein
MHDEDDLRDSEYSAETLDHLIYKRRDDRR